jgi:hypothetical protein
LGVASLWALRLASGALKYIAGMVTTMLQHSVHHVLPSQIQQQDTTSAKVSTLCGELSCELGDKPCQYWVQNQQHFGDGLCLHHHGWCRVTQVFLKCWFSTQHWQSWSPRTDESCKLTTFVWWSHTHE